jgi:hypothetical protein
VLLVLHRSRHSWCVLPNIMPAFSLMILDKVYHVFFTFLLITVDLNIRSVLITIFNPYYIPLSTTYQYLRVICRGYSFSTCLVSVSHGLHLVVVCGHLI